ncbi:Thaumatin-like protein 1 [Linum grandiflorum]
MASHSYSATLLFFTCFLTLLLLSSNGVSAATFTFVNKCDYTVWPGILGTPKLDSTGFELIKGTSRSFQAPTGWSGRFWGRTGCNFDDSGQGTCATADCGSGQIECNGAGANPPATLAEFTLGSGSQDFYDVSLVDGYNLQMIVEASGGSGDCSSTGCVTDLNRKCPSELKVDGGSACRSACEAFGNPEYCCSGAYNTPATCKPSMYSEMFKSACPKSYSYAYDDATSTFTCTAADYTITFCPSLPSLKSSSDSSPPKATSTPAAGNGSVAGAAAASGAMGGTVNQPQPYADTVQGAGMGDPWLASLATGDSASASAAVGHSFSIVLQAGILLISCFIL